MGFAGIAAERREKRQRVLNAAQIGCGKVTRSCPTTISATMRSPSKPRVCSRRCCRCRTIGITRCRGLRRSTPFGFPDATAQKRTETKEAFDGYRELILENIDYDVLANDPHVDREQLAEIAQLVQETVCNTRNRIRVAGNDYPAEVVRSKLLKLNSEHIRFVMDCLKQNTTRIQNIRQYLLATLFNAPSTMNSYYTALVAHDLAA